MSVETDNEARGRSLQFSLSTAFAVVTGICVTLSLVLWNSTFGLMAAILLVGGGWSYAAVGAGHGRLAY